MVVSSSQKSQTPAFKLGLDSAGGNRSSPIRQIFRVALATCKRRARFFERCDWAPSKPGVSNRLFIEMPTPSAQTQAYFQICCAWQTSISCGTLLAKRHFWIPFRCLPLRCLVSTSDALHTISFTGLTGSLPSACWLQFNKPNGGAPIVSAYLLILRVPHYLIHFHQNNTGQFWLSSLDKSPLLFLELTKKFQNGQAQIGRWLYLRWSPAPPCAQFELRCAAVVPDFNFCLNLKPLVHHLELLPWMLARYKAGIHGFLLSYCSWILGTIARSLLHQ